MDPSTSLDHFTDRRDLLRGFLDEYELLEKEYPDLTARLSFAAYVEFSFAYFRIGEQTGNVQQLRADMIKATKKVSNA